MFAFTPLFVYLSIFLSDYDSWSLLEGLMLNLKLQYSGHLMQRTNSLEKPLMLGKIEGKRRSGQQKMRWLDGGVTSQWTWICKKSEDSEGQKSLVCCSPRGHKQSDTTQEENDNNYAWTHPNWVSVYVRHCSMCLGYTGGEEDRQGILLSWGLHSTWKEG